MRVLICNNDDNERVGLAENIRRYCRDAGLASEIETCDDRETLIREMKQAEREIVVISLCGVEGLEAAIGASRLSTYGCIWISDLDFAVQSYRLGVNYFLKKPVSVELLFLALDHCREERHKKEIGGGFTDKDWRALV